MEVVYFEKYFTGTKEEVEKAYRAWRLEHDWITITNYSSKEKNGKLELFVIYSSVGFK